MTVEVDEGYATEGDFLSGYQLVDEIKCSVMVIHDLKGDPCCHFKQLLVSTASHEERLEPFWWWSFKILTFRSHRSEIGIGSQKKFARALKTRMRGRMQRRNERTKFHE